MLLVGIQVRSTTMTVELVLGTNFFFFLDKYQNNRKLVKRPILLRRKPLLEGYDITILGCVEAEKACQGNLS